VSPCPRSKRPPGVISARWRRATPVLRPSARQSDVLNAETQVASIKHAGIVCRARSYVQLRR